MKATPLPTDVLPTAEGYDRWSEVYETDGNPLIALEEPEVVRLLGPTKGLAILDVGCGTGRHALRLAREGARVTALDFSEGMLKKARQKQGAEAITFVQHDVARPLPFPDASFDRVLSGLVLEHVADLDLFFSEIRRVCRPDGFVLVSAMHPAMMLIGRQACFRDPRSGEKIFPKSHEHQVSDFVMAALRAGLAIDHLGEHAVTEELAERCARAEKYVGWLMLFMLRAVVAPSTR